MLQHLQSSYDAYILDTFSRDNNELTYKVLLLDKNFYAHDDHVIMCRKDDVLTCSKDSRFEFHNCSFDSDGTLWLSVCKPPQQYEYDTSRVVPMPHPKTLWEFLWDSIKSNVCIFMKDAYISATNITFSMASDDIILTSQEGKTLLLWTTNIDEAQKDTIDICCGDEFYHRWMGYLKCKDRLADGKLRVSVNLYELPYTYDGVYSSCRFRNQELVYLFDRYLLLKVHLHGVELGNWFMRKLNGIDSGLFGFKKPHIKRSVSRIQFCVDAKLPDARLLASVISKDVENAYRLFASYPDLADCLRFFGLDSIEYDNCYFVEFFKGFFSQVSADRGVIRDHEYLNAELLQTEITALACRIYVYRLIMLRRLRDTECLYLSDGTLRMEVIS